MPPAARRGVTPLLDHPERGRGQTMRTDTAVSPENVKARGSGGDDPPRRVQGSALAESGAAPRPPEASSLPIPLVIAGLTPLSSVDYPDALAAVIYCQGCPLACPYCHNAALRPMTGLGRGRMRGGCFDWLAGRIGLLDAVVFTGGEPTVQPGLGAAMARVRSLGFRVGLHTSGLAPEALAAVLPRCDWVGLDVKAPMAGYDRITGRAGSAEAAFASLGLLVAGGLDFEVRTTWHPALLDEEAMASLARELAAAGARRWMLQGFRPDGCADPVLANGGAVSAAAGPDRPADRGRAGTRHRSARIAWRAPPPAITPLAGWPRLALSSSHTTGTPANPPPSIRNKRTFPSQAKVEGNTVGLKASQVKALERLGTRRYPSVGGYTLDQARELAAISFGIGRQVGLLIDRKGPPEPDPGRHPQGYPHPRTRPVAPGRRAPSRGAPAAHPSGRRGAHRGRPDRHAFLAPGQRGRPDRGRHGRPAHAARGPSAAARGRGRALRRAAACALRPGGGGFQRPGHGPGRRTGPGRRPPGRAGQDRFRPRTGRAGQRLQRAQARPGDLPGRAGRPGRHGRPGRGRTGGPAGGVHQSEIYPGQGQAGRDRDRGPARRGGHAGFRRRARPVPDPQPGRGDAASGHRPAPS